MAKTLLELAGAEPPQPSWQDAALLLIDMQREYLDGKLALPNIKPVISEAGELLDSARRADALVVHVAHRGRSGGLFDPNEIGCDIIRPLQPRVGEWLVEKEKPSAFADTTLHMRLQEAGITRLLVAGCMTHLCVSSTVRAAVDLGYSCWVIGSACTTRDLPDADGGVIPAEQVHRVALAELADRFAWVLSDISSLQQPDFV